MVLKLKDRFMVVLTAKVVIIVNISKSMRDYVTQVVRVSDGKELLESGRCRPCDNLDDAVDVAGEMMVD